MEKEKSGRQRRRVPRISVAFPVTMAWGTKQFRLQARQLSAFGMLLASIAKGLVGEDVDIVLEAPGPILRLSGTVLYAIESGIGIGFEGLAPDQLALLNQFIQTREGNTVEI